MNLEFYREHGWQLFNNVIPSEYLEVVKRKGPDLVIQARKELKINILGCASKYDRELKSIYTSKFSYDLASAILQKEDIYIFNDQLVYKFPDDNLKFDSHYDNQFGKENKSGKIHTVNLSWILDDMTDENGTLSLKSMKTGEWVTIYPKSGDILAINGNCSHKSATNNTKKPRGLYACVYTETPITLSGYYSDPFLLKDTSIQNTHTYFDSIKVQQFKGFKKYFSKFLKQNNFDRILELGTSYGGLTYFLSSIFNGQIVTVDKDTRIVDKRVYNVAKVIQADHMSIGTVKHLTDEFLSKQGKVLVLCDGGDKPSIFNSFANVIKEGDFIMVHDYFETYNDYTQQNAWGWCECTKADILEGIQTNYLEERCTYMNNIAWGVYEKTTKKVAIPKYSSYI